MKKNNSYLARLNRITSPKMHSEQKTMIILTIAGKQTKGKTMKKVDKIATSNTWDQRVRK